MVGSRFDSWTRRRFGLTTAGAIASVLRLIERDRTTAKNNHKRKHGSLPCRKLKQSCKRHGSSGVKRNCCDRVRRLECDKVGFSRRYYCCYDYQTICSGTAGECCRDLKCGTVPGLSGRRCCAEAGAACRSANDCCDGVTCSAGFCVTVPPCLAQGEMCPEECDQGGSCAACCSESCDANRHCTGS
jgi:hypothetical protein